MCRAKPALAELCRTGPKCREAYDIPALIERGLALFDAGPLLGQHGVDFEAQFAEFG